MKRFGILVLIVLLALTAAGCSGQKSTPEEYFGIVVDENGCVIIGSYIGNEMAVVIPSRIDGRKVVGIADLAFRDNTLIRSVIIPDSVTSIGAAAFDGCTNLTRVQLPKNLTVIATACFRDCSALTEINLPGGIVEIEGSAFRYCKALASVTLPSKLEIIGDEAFKYAGLTEITLPESVRELGHEPFGGCPLAKVYLPKALDDEYVRQRFEIYDNDSYGSVPHDPHCVFYVYAGSPSEAALKDDQKYGFEERFNYHFEYRD